MLSQSSQENLLITILQQKIELKSKIYEQIRLSWQALLEKEDVIKTIDYIGVFRQAKIFNDIEILIHNFQN